MSVTMNCCIMGSQTTIRITGLPNNPDRPESAQITASDMGVLLYTDFGFVKTETLCSINFSSENCANILES